MSLALPCSINNSDLFYDLQTKKTGCITVEKSQGLQKRIQKEEAAKTVQILKLWDSYAAGKINKETYSVLKEALNTFSLTESREAVTQPDGTVVYRTLTPEEASAKFEARLKAEEQKLSSKQLV